MNIVLNATDVLTAVLSTAATTTNPTYTVTWSDTALHQVSGLLTDDTALTLVPAPSGAARQRVVESLSIYNGDTAAAIVTVARVVSSVSFKIWKASLQVGDTLIFEATGIRVVDTNGQAKTSGSTTALQPFPMNPFNWKVHDAVSTNLPITAASDDLAIIQGTDGTNFPTIKTLDFKNTTTTAYARQLIPLPANYVAGSAITIRANAGMLTTVASSACTVVFECYANSGGNAGSANLVTTSATSINSLTFGNKDFVVTPTGLVAGQMLNIRMAIVGTDSATGTAVIGAVGQVELRTSVSQ